MKFRARRVRDAAASADTIRRGPCLAGVCSVVLSALLVFTGCKKEKAENQPDEPPTAIEALENETAPMPTAPLVVGDTVFDFTALAHTGQRFRLSEFLQLPVLVYFCPEDRSDVCTQMAVSLRDQWLFLNHSVSMAFGVSNDGTFVHRDFASEHELAHLMVGDGEGVVHQVFVLKKGVVTAYLIGHDRKVLAVLAPSAPGNFALDVLATLRKLGLEHSAPPI